MTIVNNIHKYMATGRSWFQRNVSTITKLTVHHDAIPHDSRTADQVLTQIYGIHHDQKGWPGASYHYYIHTDGVIYQLNKHEDVTWHDSHNYDSLGIVMHGYFHPDYNNKPTDRQLASLKALLDDLCTNHPEFPADFDDVLAHRERWSTACPGDTFYPMVVEYREKKGQVSWTGEPSPMPTEPKTITVKLSDYERILTNSGKLDQVVNYLGLGTDAFTVSYETIEKSLAARSGNATACQRNLAVAQQEITNRVEQVSRLETELLELKKQYTDLLAGQSSGQTKCEKEKKELATTLTGQLEQKRLELDEANKEKGRALNQAAEAKAELVACKNGVEPLTGLSLFTKWLKSVWMSQ